MDRARMVQALRRAMGLRCPRCGRSPLFTGLVRMVPRCPVCGLDFERETGYFIGAIYYHMLTGKSPLQETRDRIQRLSKSRYTSVVPIQQIDPALPRLVVNVVNKAMSLLRAIEVAETQL